MFHADMHELRSNLAKCYGKSSPGRLRLQEATPLVRYVSEQLRKRENEKSLFDTTILPRCCCSSQSGLDPSFYHTVQLVIWYGFSTEPNPQMRVTQSYLSPFCEFDNYCFLQCYLDFQFCEQDRKCRQLVTYHTLEKCW